MIVRNLHDELFKDLVLSLVLLAFVVGVGGVGVAYDGIAPCSTSYHATKLELSKVTENEKKLSNFGLDFAHIVLLDQPSLSYLP